MRPSDRITGITGGSDGWEIVHRSRALIAAGRAVVELTVGEHDARTDPAILRAMHASAMAGNTGYAAVRGTLPLRQAIAARAEARTGVPTGPDEVLVTPGGQAALFAALMAAGDPGARAVLVAPYYATYPGTARAAGLVPVLAQARPGDGFVPRAEAVAGALPARAVLINSPNNPTGAVYPRAALEGIAEVVRGAGAWLISDEVYDAQVWEGAHVSPRALPGMAERTLVIGSLSKSHAMTGSRVGWVIGPADAVAAMADLATVTTYGIPGFIQEAAVFALAHGDEARVAAPFARRRALALRALGGRRGVVPLPPGGAMYLMADIRTTGLSGIAFAERLLDERGVAVMPGESFGAAAAGHVRVALTVADAALEAALGELADLADALARAAA